MYELQDKFNLNQITSHQLILAAEFHTRLDHKIGQKVTSIQGQNIESKGKR